MHTKCYLIIIIISKTQSTATLKPMFIEVKQKLKQIKITYSYRNNSNPDIDVKNTNCVQIKNSSAKSVAQHDRVTWKN